MRFMTATIDQKLSFLLVALMGIGLVAVFSASSVKALETAHDKFYIAKLQAMFMLAGSGLMLFFMRYDYRKLQGWAVPGLVFTFVLLFLLMVPGLGKTVNGATRTFRFFGLRTVQPSEVAKLTTILYLAASLAGNYRRRQSFREYLLLNIVLLSAICLLIVLQKSLSAAVLIFVVGFLMMTVAHSNLGHIFSLAAIGATAVVLFIFQQPYRLRRVLAFLDPWSDPQGHGYQVIQSLMAVGTGGITGVGVGQSIQKLDYLPFQHTDFIFSVLGEELGLIGALVVMAIYLGIFWRGIRVSIRAPDLFGMFLGFGITTTFVMQAAINIGVSLGLVPPTGMPLPLISYGGSNMLITLMSMGILLNISAAAERESLSRVSRRWSTH